ncbi:unnamed protein product [Prorocentrum cordatum]|uniref:Uncharacterized protein n=1 Tax=Prorocentrum cordatum TaxID=2364126 RepID=A0ABN9VM79_9DINO|nr:unnamed protein product [Polarella glacialis]
MYLNPPGSFQAEGATKAIENMIMMGAKADAVLHKRAAEAHHKAIFSIGASKKGVTSREAWDEVNDAVMDVCNAVAATTDPGGRPCVKPRTKCSAADVACAGSREFKDKIDWKSGRCFQPLPGVTAKQALKAVGRAIVLGSKIGAGELEASAESRAEALASAGASGVSSLCDCAAVDAAIERAVVFAPTSKAMGAFNAVAGVIEPEVPGNPMSGISPAGASKARGVLEFEQSEF